MTIKEKITKALKTIDGDSTLLIDGMAEQLDCYERMLEFFSIESHDLSTRHPDVQRLVQQARYRLESLRRWKDSL